MCQWFSCISNGKGDIYYFNREQRQAIYNGKKLICREGSNHIETRDELDSHSALARFYGLDIDKVNKYEFRPLDRYWQIDQINANDDSVEIKRQCQRLDYKEFAPPEFVWKPLIYPFKLNRKRITKKDVKLLKKWDSVSSLSNRDSAKYSVGNFVGDVSVLNSVLDSAWGSIRNFIWDSIEDFVWGYIGSFFNLKKWGYIKHKEGQYPFQPAVDLWERGIVPSCNGEIWRLHGIKGRVIYEITRQALKEK